MDIVIKPSSTHQRIAPELQWIIYTRYFMERAPLEMLVEELPISWMTLYRCVKAQRAALEAIHAGLGSTRRPDTDIHYSRYRRRVIKAVTRTPCQRRKSDRTQVAEGFIHDWWRRQQRESQDKRWVDAGKLYREYYSPSIPDKEKQVSYKTFTRAMKRVLKEAYATTSGRPNKRRRGRPKQAMIKKTLISTVSSKQQ